MVLSPLWWLWVIDVLEAGSPPGAVKVNFPLGETQTSMSLPAIGFRDDHLSRQGRGAQWKIVGRVDLALINFTGLICWLKLWLKEKNKLLQENFKKVSEESKKLKGKKETMNTDYNTSGEKVQQWNDDHKQSEAITTNVNEDYKKSLEDNKKLKEKMNVWANLVQTSMWRQVSM
jgi:hypothetical protein